MPYQFIRRNSYWKLWSSRLKLIYWIPQSCGMLDLLGLHWNLEVGSKPATCRHVLLRNNALNVINNDVIHANQVVTICDTT